MADQPDGNIEVPTEQTQPTDPLRPPIQQLGNDVLFMIFELVHDTHPASISEIKLTCSRFNHLAKHIESRTLHVKEWPSQAAFTRARLDYFERQDLLTSVRAIKVEHRNDICFGDPSPA